MRVTCMIAAFVALTSPATIACAEPELPCAGCVLDVPKSDVPSPLLVILHGDEGSPQKLALAWKKPAEDAHVVLFAPRCPKSEGCMGSWWRWNGDPSWLLHQVAAVEAHHSIDPKRLYLAGWSGGTTYASFHIARWFPTFAAVSLAGGGAARRTDDCTPHAGGACAPIHYLQGDKNPFFDLAKETHAYLEGCGHAVTWELHAGADHAGEWSAYARETGAILDWLLAHPEGCAAAMEPKAPSSAAAPPTAPDPLPTSAPSASAKDLALATTSDRGPAPRIQADPRCTCECAGDTSDASWATVLAWASVAVLTMRWRAHAKRHSPGRPGAFVSGRSRRRGSA